MPQALVTNTLSPTGNEQIITGGLDDGEVILPGCDLTLPWTPESSSIVINVWISQQSPFGAGSMTTVLRVRRTGPGGSIVASTSFSTSTDSTTGHVHQWNTTVSDTSPTSGRYVLTAEVTAGSGGSENVFTDTRTFSITGTTTLAIPASLSESLLAVHTPSYRVRIKWDGVDWTDETDRFLGGGGVSDIDATTRLPNIDQATIELDNKDHRFSLKNLNSEIYAGLQRVGHEITIEIGYNGVLDTFFYGKVTSIKPTYLAGTVQITALSSANRFATSTCSLLPTANLRTDQIAAALLQSAGFAEGTDYSLEPGAVTVQYASVPLGSNLLSELLMLNQVENGRLFFDPANNGRITMWNSLSTSVASGQPLATLTTDDHAYDLGRELTPDRGVLNDIKFEWIYRDYKDADGNDINVPIWSNWVTPPINEVQSFVFSYPATGGAFRLVYEGQQTSSLAWNASDAQIKTALEAIAQIGAGNVSVSTSRVGGGISSIVVTFISSLGRKNLNQMAIVNENLVRGSQPVATIVQDGGSGQNEIWKITVDRDLTGGTWQITLDGNTTSNITGASTPSTIQSRIRSLGNVGSLFWSNVQVTGTDYSVGLSNYRDYRIEFVLDRANTNYGNLTISGGQTGALTATAATVTDGAPGGSNVRNGFPIPPHSGNPTITPVAFNVGGGGQDNASASLSWSAYVPVEWVGVELPYVAADESDNFNSGFPIAIMESTTSMSGGVTYSPVGVSGSQFIINFINNYGRSVNQVFTTRTAYIRMRIVGHPKPKEPIVMTASDATSIANLGRLSNADSPIQNAYKPADAIAQQVVSRELARRKDASDNIVIEVDALPLRALDVVTVLDTTVPDVTTTQTKQVISNEWSIVLDSGLRSVLVLGAP